MKKLCIVIVALACSVAYSADLSAIPSAEFTPSDPQSRILYSVASNYNAMVAGTKTIPSAAIAASAIDSVHIKDGVVANADLASGVDAAKLLAGSSASAIDGGSITNVNTEFEFSTASGTFTNAAGDSLSISNGLITAIN